MEFGALHVTPKRPDCSGVLCRKTVWHFLRTTLTAYPGKIKKNKVRNRYFNYLVRGGRKKADLVTARKGGVFWQNLISIFHLF